MNWRNIARWVFAIPVAIVSYLIAGQILLISFIQPLKIADYHENHDLRSFLIEFFITLGASFIGITNGTLIAPKTQWKRAFIAFSVFALIPTFYGSDLDLELLGSALGFIAAIAAAYRLVKNYRTPPDQNRETTKVKTLELYFTILICSALLLSGLVYISETNPNGGAATMQPEAKAAFHVALACIFIIVLIIFTVSFLLRNWLIKSRANQILGVLAMLIFIMIAVWAIVSYLFSHQPLVGGP